MRHSEQGEESLFVLAEMHASLGIATLESGSEVKTNA
jgi:hypothetical protein